MGFNNPPVPWSTLERTLSGRPPAPDGDTPDEVIRDPITIDHGDGTDTPSWTRKRARYEAPAFVRTSSTVDYAELHCHSNFSFLDGASHPEELAEEAARLGLTALGRTDHDGFYGVVRFAEAARELGLPTVFGAELSLGPARPAERRTRPDRGAPAGAGPRAGRVRAVAATVIARGPAGAARRRGGPVYAIWSRSRRSCAGTCWCSPAAARDRCPGRC